MILNQNIVSNVYVIENDNQLVGLLRVFGILLPILGIENFLSSLLISLGKEKVLCGVNLLGGWLGALGLNFVIHFV